MPLSLISSVSFTLSSNYEICCMVMNLLNAILGIHFYIVYSVDGLGLKNFLFMEFVCIALPIVQNFIRLMFRIEITTVIAKNKS